MLQDTAVKTSSYNLARAFCKLLDSENIKNWVLSGLEGLELGQSRDLDLLIERKITPKEAQIYANLVVKELDWEYLGMDNRFYGHIRLFFISSNSLEAFEIDLLPDFMLGPIDVCEGERNTEEINGFSVCSNASFSKKILIKLLSGNFESIKKIDYPMMNTYIESSLGRKYLSFLIGEKLTIYVLELIKSNGSKSLYSKNRVLLMLIWQVLFKKPHVLTMRLFRWIIFEWRKYGGFGLVVPVLSISNTDKDEAYDLVYSIENTIKEIIPFSQFVGPYIGGRSLFSRLNPINRVRRNSANLNLVVLISSEHRRSTHLTTRAGQVFIDAKKFDRNLDCKKIKELFEESFIHCLVKF